MNESAIEKAAEAIVEAANRYGTKHMSIDLANYLARAAYPHLSVWEEPTDQSLREREFCEWMIGFNSDPKFVQEFTTRFIAACNERVLKGGYPTHFSELAAVPESRDTEVGALRAMLKLYRNSQSPRMHGTNCRFRKYPDWPQEMDDRCDICKVVDGLLPAESAAPERNAPPVDPRRSVVIKVLAEYPDRAPEIADKILTAIDEVKGKV